MSKKITFGAKPPAGRAASLDPDEWVRTGRAEPPPVEDAEPMKRLTIDVPMNLHTRIKVTCARRGVKIADEVRALLEQHFADEPTNSEIS